MKIIFGCILNWFLQTTLHVTHYEKLKNAKKFKVKMNLLTLSHSLSQFFI